MSKEAMLLCVYPTGDAWLQDRGSREDMEKEADKKNKVMAGIGWPWVYKVKDMPERAA